MRGEIGEAEKKGRTKQEVSKIEAETAVLDTKRRGDKAQADAELTNRQTELNMGIQLAQIKAKRQAESRDAELQKDVEQKKAATELERLRATDVTKAKIARETAEQKADAHVYTARQDAEAAYFRQVKDAEAAYTRQIKEADAAFYAKKKEAEGISAVAQAYKGMAEVLGGPQGLLQYMMLQNNTYEKMALANAKAINGLQPKITVWNTGENAGSSDSTAPIRNLFQSLPPLLSTINDQTGIAPPSWLVGSMGKGGAAEYSPATKPKMNGVEAGR
jgi:flotillin